MALSRERHQQNFFIYSSTNLLVALSVDRWEAVVKPLAFTKNRSRGLYLVVGSWVLAAITCLPVTFFMKVAEIEGVTQCWIDMSNYVWRIYMIYLTCLLLIIPTLIIAICYIHIVYTIWSKGRLGGGMVAAGEKRRLCQDERGTDKMSNFTSSFYGTGPYSLQRELSSSTTTSRRLNARASNLSSDSAAAAAAAAHFQRQDSVGKRLVSWAEGRAFRIQRPLRRRADTCESEAGDENKAGRRASAESATALAERLVKFKRSRTIETTLGEGKQKLRAHETGNSIDSQPQRRPARERTDERASLAGHQGNENSAPDAGSVRANVGFVGWSPDNEAHNQVSCGVAGPQSKHLGPSRKQSGQSSQAVSEDNKNNSNNRHSEPTQAMEQRPSADDNSQTAPAASQPQHKSGLSRVASQGLRMLSFARSHSSSSVSSTPSTGSSSSTIAPKLRLTTAAPTSTQIVSTRALEHRDVGSARGSLLQTGTERGAAASGATEGPSHVRSRSTDASRRSGAMSGRDGGHYHDHRDGQPKSGSQRLGQDETRELAVERGNEPTCEPGQWQDSSLLEMGANMIRIPTATDDNPSNYQPDLKTAQSPRESRTISDVEKSPKSDQRTLSDALDKRHSQSDEQQQQRAKFEGPGRDRDFVAQQHGSGVIPKARIKTIKMTLVIVVTYILCWSPFVIVNFLNTFGFTEHNHFWQAMSTCTQTFAHINSAVNPLIFWLFSGRRSQSNAANRKPQTNQLNSNQPPAAPAAARQTNKIATNGAL